MEALICTLYKMMPSSGGQSIDSTFLFWLLHSIVVVPLKWADCSSCGLWTTFGEAGRRNQLSLHSGSTTSCCPSWGWWLKSGERLKSFKHVCIFYMFGTSRHCFIWGVCRKNKTNKKDIFYLPKSATYMQWCKCNIRFKYNPGYMNFV